MAELLFAPLIERIRSTGGEVLGSQLVEEIKTGDDGAVTAVVARLALLSPVPPELPAALSFPHIPIFALKRVYFMSLSYNK